MKRADDPDESERRHRRTDYHVARVGAAAALTLVTVVILILDAIVPNYDVSPITLAALCGTICALVGVEIRRMY